MWESVAVNMMVKKHSSRIGQFPQSYRQKQPNITKMNKKPWQIPIGIFAVIVLVITIICISNSSRGNIANQRKIEYDFSIPFDAITVWYLEPNTFDEISKEISIDKLNEKAKTYDICYLSDSEKTLSVNSHHMMN